MMSSEIPPSADANVDGGWLKETTVRAYFLVTLHEDLGVLPSKPLRIVIRTGKTAEMVRALSITCVE